MAPRNAALAKKMEIDEKKARDRELMERISLAAKDKVSKAFDGSIAFAGVDEALRKIPKLAKMELRTGKVLGRGQFAVVKEIKGVDLRVEDIMRDSVVENDPSLANCDALPNGRDGDVVRDYVDLRKSDPKVDYRQMINREFLATHCLREGKDARYAVKSLSEANVSDPQLFYQAAQDLALEVHILSTVEHPNIVKMRALSIDGLCTKNFFVVMDRLYNTLEKRQQQWKRVDDSTTGAKGKLFDSKGKKRQQLLDERLKVALDLASALEYLHSQNIVHRDIKPDNIGFDVRGDVKLYDFGLAKELRKEDRVGNGSLYKLTGNTGTMLYMAPEVYKEEPYNEKADLYSFGLLLWGILSLERPFAGFSMLMMKQRVFDQGHRPKICDGFSSTLNDIVRGCWSQSVEKRLSSVDAANQLRKEICSVRLVDHEEFLKENSRARRRSTFVAPLQ